MKSQLRTSCYEEHLTLVSANNLAISLHALDEHEQARRFEDYVRTRRPE